MSEAIKGLAADIAFRLADCQHGNGKLTIGLYEWCVECGAIALYVPNSAFLDWTNPRGYTPLIIKRRLNHGD